MIGSTRGAVRGQAIAQRSGQRRAVTFGRHAGNHGRL
jgi:hypothetical protein